MTEETSSEGLPAVEEPVAYSCDGSKGQQWEVLDLIVSENGVSQEKKGVQAWEFLKKITKKAEGKDEKSQNPG